VIARIQATDALLPSAREHLHQCLEPNVRAGGAKSEAGGVMSDPKAAVNNAEELHPLLRASAAGTVPIANLIGFEARDIAGGRAVTTMQTGPQHANPMGTLHGGILCDLADAAMGMALVSTLAHDQSFTTVNLSIQFFRPVWTARLTAEAVVIQRGKTTGYVECTVKDENGKLVAKAASTCMVLSGERAAGR
jgi:uncharacterized protein (TIGR00369 family)